MKKIITACLIGSLVSPLASFAYDNLPTNEGMPLRQELRRNELQKREDRSVGTSTRLRVASSTKSLGFCSQIDKVIVKVDSLGSTATEKRAEKRDERSEKRDDRRLLVDEKRTENDKKRTEQLAELTRRATTDEQKQAVQVFTDEVEKALVVKKEATDALLVAHRKDVDQIVATRKAAVDAALATLQSSIETAKKKAIADCASGASGDVVRTTLKESIVTAQQTFRKSVQSVQKEQSMPKIEDRKKELESIHQAFRKSVEQARVNLKAAFAKAQTATSTQ